MHHKMNCKGDAMCLVKVEEARENLTDRTISVFFRRVVTMSELDSKRLKLVFSWA